VAAWVPDVFINFCYVKKQEVVDEKTKTVAIEKGATTPSIMTFSIKTLSIKGLYV
jgi:hypothetical protein